MYTVTKNTKLTSLVLMFIGLVALGYGFIQAAGHYTDEEVTHQIEAFANDLQLYMVDYNDAHHSVEEDHFVPLFHKIEEEFHLHFTNDEMIEARDFEHVIHSTIHALHAKAQRPWSSLLVAAIFFLGASLLSVFFLALQYVAEVGWSAILKRVFMAIGSFLPYMAFLILLIILTGGFHLFGNHTYHWMADGIMDPESSKYDAIIAGKEAYLNFGFFFIRALIYFGGWIWAHNKLTSLSLQEDIHGGVSYYNTSKKISAIFIVFFAVSSSMMAWDWIMSIDTHWFSTLFGWYVFASMFVTALVVIFMVVTHLKKQGQLEYYNESHHHDLAKFIFAFSIFWTYLWFAQFMLIWYSNIPEEVTYYIARFDDYKVPFMTALFFNFAVPIIMLMSRDAKRITSRVLVIGSIILVGHYLDFFVMIMPGTVGSHWSLGFVEIGAFLGLLGLFIRVVSNKLSSMELTPKNHPMLKESKHFHI